jgi:hypothetical protein
MAPPTRAARTLVRGHVREPIWYDPIKDICCCSASRNAPSRVIKASSAEVRKHADASHAVALRARAQPCNETPPSCLLPRRQPIPAGDAGERATRGRGQQVKDRSMDAIFSPRKRRPGHIRSWQGRTQTGRKRPTLSSGRPSGGSIRFPLRQSIQPLQHIANLRPATDPKICGLDALEYRV